SGDKFRVICLDSRYAMESVAKNTRTIVLASGTLSPTTSYEAELGLKFKHKIIGNHVVPPENVLIKRISHSLNGKRSLRLTYNAYNDIRIVSDIGELLISVCQTMKLSEVGACGGGVLCFFPSYQAMSKCIEIWKTAMDDVWKSLMRETNGCIYVEDPLRNTINGYIESIACGEVSLMCAVHRGRISEGIDFSDNLARAVISIGIPFPSTQQEDVHFKMKFNDARQPQLLDGRHWYQIQAMRAVNQAVGRCIRHSKDWGLILLVDHRFFQNEIWIGMSDWIKCI
uniref:ATP-dependent helicase C-terminal domain-containing protein n=3 Tax=Ixodes scapularis TaxID=6945 RepID=A0A1S4LQL6_IXOSC